MANRPPSQMSYPRGPDQHSSNADPRKHSPANLQSQNSGMFHHPSFIKQASTTGHITSSQGRPGVHGNQGSMPQRMQTGTSIPGGYPHNAQGMYAPPGAPRMPMQQPNYHGGPPGGYSNGMPPLGVGGPQPSIGGPPMPGGGNPYQNVPPPGSSYPPNGPPGRNNPYSMPMHSPRQHQQKQMNHPNNNQSGMKPPPDMHGDNKNTNTQMALTKNPSIAPPSNYNPSIAYGHQGQGLRGGPPPPYGQPNNNQPLNRGGHDPSLHAYQQPSIMNKQVAVQPGGQNRRGYQPAPQPTPAPPVPVPTNKKGTSNDVPKYQEPKIQNLVSTANLKCSLDLLKIGNNCRNAQYNPKRFAALIMRLKEPTRTTALIFKNGKMVITGAKSEMDSEHAAKLYTKAIKSVGNPSVKLSEFKIQNMVASCSVNFKIKLEQLYHSDHRNFCDFNPETFPGLIYHLEQPKVCLLIFASGKIVLTGAKTREDIRIAFKEIQPLLKQHQKNDLRGDQAQAGKSSTSATISNRR